MTDLFGLVEVPDVGIEVLSSRGTDVQAAVVGRRVADAHRYLSKVVGFEPRVRVAALDAKDLSKVTSFPVFGFPHFVDDDIIVVGSQPSSSFDEKLSSRPTCWLRAS